MMGAMTELVTTFLDALGLLVVAAGTGLALSQWIGWWGMVASGVIVLVGSALAARRRR